MNRKWAGGRVARRFSGRVLYGNGGHRSVKWLNRIRVVHARSVVTEIAEVLVSERKRWYGVEGAGRRGDKPTQANARGGGLDRVKPQAWMR